MLSWPVLDLLKFMALDPNIARILATDWRDSSPDPSKYVRLPGGRPLFPDLSFQPLATTIEHWTAGAGWGESSIWKGSPIHLPNL